MRQFGYLIAELKKRTDVDGKPLLDNTVILHANCASNGAAHSVRRVPWMLAGKGGGYFKTGQFLKYGGWAGKTGDFWTGACVPQNGVLVALCNAMGVPMETFGDNEYGGELAGLKA